jgi:hypothetical protein
MHIEILMEIFFGGEGSSKVEREGNINIKVKWVDVDSGSWIELAQHHIE